MKTLRLPAVAAVAVLLGAAACRTPGPPYAAPAPGDARPIAREAAARLVVAVAAETDPRVSPPWIATAERAADAVAAALVEAGFRATRGSTFRWDVRVTVGAPIRGADLAVVVDAKGKVLDRLEANGGAWGPGELAELGRAVRQRLERSDGIAALAGVPPQDRPGPAGPAAQPGAAPGQPPACAGSRRLAVLEFRGAAPPQILALLADQARAAAADAGRTSGTTVLTRERVHALLAERGRAPAPCADAACELDAARAAGVELAVTGEVAVVGAARFLVLKLVDVPGGALVASREARGDDDLALVEAARPAAAALFR